MFAGVAQDLAQDMNSTMAQNGLVDLQALQLDVESKGK